MKEGFESWEGDGSADGGGVMVDYLLFKDKSWAEHEYQEGEVRIMCEWTRMGEKWQQEQSVWPKSNESRAKNAGKDPTCQSILKLEERCEENLSGCKSITNEEVMLCIAKDHIDALVFQDDLPQRRDVDVM